MLNRWVRRGVTLSAAVVGLAAAAPAPAPMPDPVSLTVTNNNFYDMHIYGWRDGVYQSLGVVNSFSTEKVSVPEFLAAPGADFRLIADPIGGSGVYASAPIVVSPGQTVELRIENSIGLSSVVVR